MIYFVCSIYDVKAHAFAPPAFFPAKGVAIRAFIDAITEKRGDLGKHPEDFVLHQLGTFDDSNGHLENTEKPVILAAGNDYASPPPEVK